MGFLKATTKILWETFKNISISCMLMLVVLSVMSGKFPPPVFEIYKSLSAVQKDLNVGTNLKGIVERKKENESLLRDIENTESYTTASRSPQSVDEGSKVNQQATIQALEYEVARLKMQMATLEEAAQSCSKRQQ